MFPDRFVSKYIEDKSSGCWVWSACTDSAGYGRFYAEGRPVLAHRFAYRAAGGNIPNGFDIHHICKNKSCVNPDHLDALDRKSHITADDTQRFSRAKRFCVHGHERSKQNTFINASGSRECLQCKRKSGRIRSSSMAEAKRSERINDGLPPTRHNADKTICVNGHDFDDVNTYVNRRTGHRKCRECARDHERNKREVKQNSLYEQRWKEKDMETT